MRIASLKAALMTMAVLLSACVSKYDSDRVQLDEADQFAKQGLLRESIERYRSVLARHPDNLWAKRNLGITYLRIRDYSAAIANLESAIPKFPADFEVNYALAEAYRASEKFPEAIFRYQKSLEILPRDSRALKGVAWSYYRLRYYPEALANIRQIKSVNDTQNDGQAAIIEARILGRMEHFDDALRVIRKSKTELGDKAALAYLLSAEGEILASRGDCVAANKVFRDALKRQPLLAGPLFGIGKCLVKDAKPELAVEYLERSVRLRPNLTEGYLLLSEALSETDKGRASKYYKKFRQLAANDPDWMDQVKNIAARMQKLEAFEADADIERKKL